MLVSSVKASQSQTDKKFAGQGSAHFGDNDLPGFNLRDTLNGIIVRETSFGEFLSELRRFGLHTTKQ